MSELNTVTTYNLNQLQRNAPTHYRSRCVRLSIEQWDEEREMNFYKLSCRMCLSCLNTVYTCKQVEHCPSAGSHVRRLRPVLRKEVNVANAILSFTHDALRLIQTTDAHVWCVTMWRWTNVEKPISREKRHTSRSQLSTFMYSYRAYGGGRESRCQRTIFKCWYFVNAATWRLWLRECSATWWIVAELLLFTRRHLGNALMLQCLLPPLV